jgi:hypothetical protein
VNVVNIFENIISIVLLVSWEQFQVEYVPIKATTHNNKDVKPMQFPYHMCGLMGHKMVKCPWFVEM